MSSQQLPLPTVWGAVPVDRLNLVPVLDERVKFLERYTHKSGAVTITDNADGSATIVSTSPDAVIVDNNDGSATIAV